jgi:hypothetical protein
VIVSSSFVTQGFAVTVPLTKSAIISIALSRGARYAWVLAARKKSPAMTTDTSFLAVGFTSVRWFFGTVLTSPMEARWATEAAVTTRSAVPTTFQQSSFVRRAGAEVGLPPLVICSNHRALRSRSVSLYPCICAADSEARNRPAARPNATPSFGVPNISRPRTRSSEGPYSSSSSRIACRHASPPRLCAMRTTSSVVGKT